jgi:hypothetical protein
MVGNALWILAKTRRIYGYALFKFLDSFLTLHTFQTQCSVKQSRCCGLQFMVTGRSLLPKPHHAFPKPQFFRLSTHYPYL